MNLKRDILQEYALVSKRNSIIVERVLFAKLDVSIRAHGRL